MYSREKEFIANAFMKGWLDLGDGYGAVKAFCEIMAGEMEALIAIEHAGWLSEKEKAELLKIAKPTRESCSELERWIEGVHNPKPRRSRVK